MPVIRGDRGRDMGETNDRLREEIENDILDNMLSIDDYLVNQNSIILSKNFHLDAKSIGDGRHKVDIQYKPPFRKTVADVLLSDNAQNIEDLKTGLRKSLNDGYIYNVT